MEIHKIANRQNYFLKKEFTDTKTALAEWEVKLNVPFTVDDMKVRNVLHIVPELVPDPADDAKTVAAGMIAGTVHMSGIGDLCPVNNLTQHDMATTFRIGEKMASHYMFSVRDTDNSIYLERDLYGYLIVHIEFLSYVKADSF